MPRKSNKPNVTVKSTTTHPSERPAMSKKNASSHSSAPRTHHTAKEKESHPMSTPSSTAPHVEAAVVHVTASAAPAAPGASPSATAAAPTTASPPATSLVTVPLPPAGMTIPTPPADFSPATPGEFKTVVPRQAELASLSQALTDLANFTSFDQTMGALAPSLAEVTQAFTAGAKWSTTRQATEKWDEYASLMEGLAWRLIRALLDTLRPAFALAVKRNPKLAEQYAGLAKLLTFPATTAATASATKAANKKAIAEGKPPIHGKVGKKRQRKAEKAALAAGNAATPPTGGTTATAAQSPAAAPAQPSGMPTTANAANANGVSHS